MAKWVSISNQMNRKNELLWLTWGKRISNLYNEKQRRQACYVRIFEGWLLVLTITLSFTERNLVRKKEKRKREEEKQSKRVTWENTFQRKRKDDDEEGEGNWKGGWSATNGDEASDKESFCSFHSSYDVFCQILLILLDVCFSNKKCIAPVVVADIITSCLLMFCCTREPCQTLETW